ncbi:MAG: Na/Pi cotransporter family protein [Spirochaetales bacterium]|nr:Na/Pi cotransporter family protein [Spirochaetales bacterium]
MLNFAGQVLGFAGSLCLLLFGMDMLSNGIQKGAGNNLHKLLGHLTGNRISAVFTGIAVTAIIQSSGATTVMVVSFVNAEIISLTQAIGIIFGANIGTTVTAWIVSFFGFNFSIASAAIPLFGVGFVLKYFRKRRIHDFADCFMGFALLFMGLGFLKDALSLKPESMAFLAEFSNLGFLGLCIGVFIGAFVTALIHSSSAMTAIVLTMAANGSLSWEFSAAIVLGSNIGSTIDAVLSAFNASVNAKRTAAVHVAFNVAGTLLALCVFKPFLHFVDFIVPGVPKDNITVHIAMLHTIFNLCATLIFIPFVNQIAFLVTKLIKERPEEKDEHYRLPAILPSSHISADLYSFQIEKEISRMAARVMELFDFAGQTLLECNVSKSEECSEKLGKARNYVDEMNEAITDFLQKCSRLPTANKADRNHFTRLIQIADSLNNLGEECGSVMRSIEKYFQRTRCAVSSDKEKKLYDYLDLVRIFYEQACEFIAAGISPEQKLQSDVLEEKIDSVKKELKKSSRKRIESGYDVKTELVYIDIVRKIEKAGDCVYTIVQAL